MINQIHNMDCIKGLKSLSDDSVHLCFTSPPYNVGIDYDVHDDNMEWSEYIEFMINTFTEVYQVLVPGGRCAINIPTVVKVGDEYINVLQTFSNLMEGIGFTFRDLIIWCKGRNLDEVLRLNSTNWGSWKSPRNPSVRSFTEYIVVFCKESRVLEGVDTDLESEEFPIFTNNIWLIPGSVSKYHRATFPLELSNRVIKLFSWVGNTILDPFAGIGTTLISAKRLDRRYIGFEISGEYCRRARLSLSKNYTMVEASTRQGVLF